MTKDNDGWEPVPLNEIRQSYFPKPPPSRTKVSPQDANALAKYREAADAARMAARAGKNFDRVDDRFQTGRTKAWQFGMMYPDTSGGGILGLAKAAGGTALRGTMGYLFPNSDHEAYQYLNSQASALNNAALRLNKGVQTEGDSVRIAQEHPGVDKSPGVNHALVNGILDNAAVTVARDRSAAKWAADYGGLTGTKNPQGQTYDDWFTSVAVPQALARSRADRAAPSPSKSNAGWTVTRVK